MKIWQLINSRGGENEVIERLLDPHTIKEMCANTDVTARQRTAAEKWLKMLDDGNLENEKKNYMNFFKIILIDLLGYSEDQIKHEEDFVDFSYVEKGKTVACIEVKGTSTKNLFMPQPKGKREHETPVKQTWNYVGSTNAEYGICTNYRDFVLITKKFALTKYHIFDFQSIRDNPAALREFLGVFSMRSLSDGFPYGAQAKSADADRALTAEFYELYSRTRLMLIREFEDKGLAKDDAVSTAQTFLNRLMFVFFAEDTNLVKDGMFDDDIVGILKGNVKTNTRRIWNYIVEELFAAFEAGQADPYITAFNGGLFEKPLQKPAFFPDKRKRTFFDTLGPDLSRRGADSWEYKPRVADAVRSVDDLNPVIGNLLKISSYDFQSQLRVDILGHIFENSVTDLDILLDKHATTRKREGIFYTPEYVTEYVCSHTIVRYLSPSGKASDPVGLVKEYDGDLDRLHDRMNCIRILDPACGSGAFLIRAARTLIKIHEEIVKHKYNGDEQNNALDQSIDAGRISEIVRNSIYGIDKNPQSVDIARLSLFLLTAADGEKLPDLSGNVVVGNSVVADSDQGGLDWEKVFPSVFDGENPGFSVIIGNPPFVRQELLSDSDKHAMAVLPDTASLVLPENFSIPKTSDLSAYFYYHSLCRLCKGGRLGFISSDNWLRTQYGGPLRQTLLSNSQIETLVSPGFKVFHDANVNTVIILLIRKPPEGDGRILFANVDSDSDFAVPSLNVVARVPPSDLGTKNWYLYFDGATATSAPPPFPTASLKATGVLKRGIGTGNNDFFVLSRNDVKRHKIPSAYLRPVVTGGELPRLEAKHATRYVLVVRDSKGILAKTAQGRLVKKYIEHGEAMIVMPKKGGRSDRVPLPKLPTIASRTSWYSLPAPAPPPIFISRINDRTIRVYENGAGGRGRGSYQALDTYLHFTPNAKAHTSAFLAYFASSYFALDMEKNAAPLGGGALRIDNHVLAKALVPAFDRLSPRAVQGMEDAWSKYCSTLDRKKLDEAVFAALGMAQQLGSVRAELDRLVDRRMRTSRRADDGGV